MRHWKLTVSLMLAAAVRWSAAEEATGADPNLARGIAPSTTFRTFGVDTINEFNGNLMLRIPIGGSLPVGPLLNQTLVLAYNSKLYDFQYLQELNEDGQWISKRRALPESISNAGFGWTLQLGRLMPPSQPGFPSRGWYYLASDGSEHDFDALDDDGEAYTHDASFLRLRRHPSNAAQPAQYLEVTFPDGTIQRFDPLGRLQETRDRLGHWIRVDYSDSARWTITNGYDTTAFRTTTINFVQLPPPANHTYQPNFQSVVESVVLPAFGTTDGARYDFSYAGTVFSRQYCGDPIGIDGLTFAAPLLTQIRFPDGSTYVPAYSGAGGCQAGAIESLTLPTLGSVHWQHGTYRLPNEKCDEDDGWVSGSAGVAKRSLVDASGTTVAVWEYVSDVNEDTSGAYVACGPMDGWNLPYGLPPTRVTTTVTQKELVDGVLVPVGGSTVHYFSGLRNVPRARAIGYVPAEYGLPFTRDFHADSNPARFLSSQRLDESGQVVQSDYVTYEGDPQSFNKRLSNPRVRGQLTVMDGDQGCSGGACRVDVDRTDYDGYGHFRQSTTTSNFGPARTTFTNYLPRADTWILGVYDSTGVEEGGVARKQMFTFDANGFLVTRRTLAATAATAGSIASDHRKDLLAVTCRDARGFIQTEKFFGGDGTTANLPSSNLCDRGTTTRATEYQIDHTYVFGSGGSGAPVKHTARYAGVGIAMVDEDLDANTGLAAASRDASEVRTDYVYDSLGRLTELRPAGRAWVRYEYTRASATDGKPASLRVTTRRAGTTSAATPLTTAIIHYDSFGRPVQAKRLMPAGSGTAWSTANTVYDLFSREVSASMPEFRSTDAHEAFVPANVIRRDYDVFGRARSVTSPDGTRVSFTYTGQRKKTVTRNVATTIGSAESPVSSTEHFDPAGRLVKVVENAGPTSASGPIGATVTTEYTYDGADHLTSVKMTGVEGVVQNRVFDYDGRGYLRWESHPESGITAYSYDSRGHMLSKLHGGASSPFDLKYLYDGAERLLRVDGRNRFHDPADPQQPEFHVVKEFEYATDNVTASSPPDLRKGKLLAATRYNYSVTPHAGNAGYLESIYKVKEIYAYKDAAGRKTDRRTLITKYFTCCEPDGWGLVQDVETKVAYDDLDQPKEIGYPVCIGCGAPGSTWHPRLNLAPTYSQGRVTAVPSFVNSLTYWPDGMRDTLLHSNSMADTQLRDPHAMTRPKSISSALFNSCTPPSFDLQPVGGTTTSPGAGILLSVSVSGTGPFRYQWVAEGSGEIPGATGASYLAQPAVTTNYYVFVSNACYSGLASRTATVTVGACRTPTVRATSNRNPDGSWTLDAYYSTGSEPLTFVWRRVADGAEVGHGTKIVLQVPQTAEFEVQVSNDCGVAATKVLITVPLPMASSGLRAEKAAGANHIQVTWPPSAGAARYRIERRDAVSDWTEIGVSTTASYSDSSIAANSVYAYRVLAVDAQSGSASPYSNADVATTIVYPDIAAGSVVSASAFNQMLDAVNAARRVARWPNLTWANIIAPSIPLPVPGNVVHASHIGACRARMNEALSALGVPVGGYTNPDLSGAVIRALYVAEIQERLR